MGGAVEEDLEMAVGCLPRARPGGGKERNHLRRCRRRRRRRWRWQWAWRWLRRCGVVVGDWAVEEDKVSLFGGRGAGTCPGGYRGGGRVVGGRTSSKNGRRQRRADGGEGGDKDLGSMPWLRSYSGERTCRHATKEGLIATVLACVAPHPSRSGIPPLLCKGVFRTQMLFGV